MFALILSDDLALLVDSVRRKLLAVDAQCGHRGYAYTWNFEVRFRANGTPLPLPAQRALLEPFKKIRYREQRCFVRGEVDSAISAELQSAMQPNIFWRRADEVHAFLDLLYKSELDLQALMQKREWLAATQLIREIEMFLEVCRTFCEDIKLGDNPTVQIAFTNMLGRTAHHKLVIDLRLALTQSVGKNMRHLVAKVLSQALPIAASGLTISFPLIQLICATCHFASGDFGLCWDQIDRIHSESNKNEWADLCLKLQQLETGLPKNHRRKSWRPSPGTSRRVLLDLASLVNPIAAEDKDFQVQFSSNAGTAALERYILRALPYTGDMLDDDPETVVLDPKYAFDPKVADRVIAKYKKELANAAADERKHIIDIGPKPVQFDINSPFKLYRPGPGFEHFRDGQFKVSERGDVLPIVDVPERPAEW